jgi:uncharacterized protein
MFIGRTQEIQDLNSLYKKGNGGIAVIYGRRRVGKTALIKYFIEGKSAYFFEGIEGENCGGPQKLERVISKV